MSHLLQQFLRDSTQQHPDTLAVDDGTAQLTYAELSDLTARYRTLLHQHDLPRGRHIAVFSTNNADYVALYFAAAQLGLVIVPMNAHLKSDEISWILRDCAPVAVFVQTEFLDTFVTALDDSRINCAARFIMDGTHDDWSSLRDIPVASDTTGSDGNPNELAIQMYTSGTTGRPKGVMLSHANMTSLVLSWLDELPLTAGESRFMQATPLFHVGGLLICLSTLASGASLYMLPKFEPGLALDVLRSKDITHTLLVPAMIQRLLLLPGIDEQPFPHLGMMVYGASLMPTAALRRAHGVFGCRFLQGYGLTETSGVALCLRPDDHDFDNEVRLTAAGKPLGCCDVRLSADGEIEVKGSNVMLGYWNNPTATAETLIDGWLRTGDLGRMDDEGYIYVVGRSKEMIDYSGENVYPAEVENVLESHDAVAEVTVIGLPDTRTGEAVVAVVVAADAARDSLTGELTALCRERLARFKCPTRYIYRSELPRTPAGKVKKHELQDEYS